MADWRSAKCTYVGLGWEESGNAFEQRERPEDFSSGLMASYNLPISEPAAVVVLAFALRAFRADL